MTEPRRLLVLLALGSVPALADTTVSTPPLERTAAGERARQLWRALPTTKDGCPDFDYFPEGGMRNFYCHLLTKTSWAELQKLAGMKVFLKGPHSRTRLDLKSRRGFGYYNPEFVRWLGKTFVPGADDTAFRRATQPIYDQYVRPLARTFLATHERLHSQPDDLEAEKRALSAAIARGTVEEAPYEKYYSYLEESGGVFHGRPGATFDGNVVKTAVAFWIRRSIDGTDKDFFAALEKLLATYDPGFAAAR